MYSDHFYRQFYFCPVDLHDVWQFRDRKCGSLFSVINIYHDYIDTIVLDASNFNKCVCDMESNLNSQINSQIDAL